MCTARPPENSSCRSETPRLPAPSAGLRRDTARRRGRAGARAPDVPKIRVPLEAAARPPPPPPRPAPSSSQLRAAATYRSRLGASLPACASPGRAPGARTQDRPAGGTQPPALPSPRQRLHGGARTPRGPGGGGPGPVPSAPAPSRRRARSGLQGARAGAAGVRRGRCCDWEGGERVRIGRGGLGSAGRGSVARRGLSV